MFWRRGSESNRRMRVLQTLALPLGYRAVREGLFARYRAASLQVKPREDREVSEGPAAVHRWPSSDQKKNFSANWMILGSAAE